MWECLATTWSSSAAARFTPTIWHRARRSTAAHRARRERAPATRTGAWLLHLDVTPPRRGDVTGAWDHSGVIPTNTVIFTHSSGDTEVPSVTRLGIQRSPPLRSSSPATTSAAGAKMGRWRPRLPVGSAPERSFRWWVVWPSCGTSRPISKRRRTARAASWWCQVVMAPENRACWRSSSIPHGTTASSSPLRGDWIRLVRLPCAVGARSSGICWMAWTRSCPRAIYPYWREIWLERVTSRRRASTRQILKRQAGAAEPRRMTLLDTGRPMIAGSDAEARCVARASASVPFTMVNH
jgi:hypothetical protein